MWRRDLATVEVIGPVMDGTDDVLRVAGAGEQLRLAVTANIGNELRAAIVSHQQFAGLQPAESEVLAVGLYQ